MEEKRPKVGVGVMIIKNDKLLFLKRKGAHGSGSWSFPGGHLEFNESLEDCAAREVMEEIGLKIKWAKFLTATNDIFEKEGKHYITMFMKAEINDEEPKIMEPDKCDEINWFSWNELPSPLFVPIENLVKSGFNPFKFN